MKLPSKEFFGQMFLSILGGGIIGPLTFLGFLNYGCRYETCSRIGLFSGVIVGSLCGFLIWQYSTWVQTYFLKSDWFRTIGVYLFSMSLWLVVIFSQSFLVNAEPKQWILVGITIPFFIFSSMLSIIPFLIYKGIQHLAVKK
jgi:uncharacterized membrane-anchored protein